MALIPPPGHPSFWGASKRRGRTSLQEAPQHALVNQDTDMGQTGSMSTFWSIVDFVPDYRFVYHLIHVIKEHLRK